MQRWKEDDPQFKQPFLIMSSQHGGFAAEKPTFFLVLDREIVLVPYTLPKVLTILFCAFFAFNLHYPPVLNSVYGVIQQMLGLKLLRKSEKGFRPNPSSITVFNRLDELRRQSVVVAEENMREVDDGSPSTSSMSSFPV